MILRRLAGRRALPAALAAACLIASLPAAAQAASVTGTAYKDLNRDAARQASEPVLSGQQLYLFDAAGGYLGTTLTDAAGAYAFAGLADGDYRVEYRYADWDALRQNWVPSTTGSIRPVVNVNVPARPRGDFGWRPIVRSTDPAAPISSYTGPSGLRVSSYDDVVSARELHDALAAGLIGAEAPSVRVFFDLGTNGSNCASSAGQDATGRWTSYAANVYVSYLSWVDAGDQELTHEYGHAWSGYFAHIAQQDPSWSGYLRARGLQGDPRLNSSYEWSVGEMIAEDYRQLFGSANARRQSQLNSQIPTPDNVPGLRDYLTTTFRSATGGSPAPAPAPAPALAITGLAMNPATVVSTGTASLNLSAPASVTLAILDNRAKVVRTLLSGASRQAGAVTAAWDRRTDAGRTAKAGAYVLRATAVDGSGKSVSASVNFKVG